VELTGLDDDLTTGQNLELVLTFDNAGEVPVTAPVGTPDEEEERGEVFDFHEGSGEHSEGGEDGAG
jgi:copper(I)-binding protein